MRGSDMSTDMFGRELRVGDLVFFPLSHSGNLLEVVEVDVKNERPSLVTDETLKIRRVRVRLFKRIVGQHPRGPRVISPDVSESAWKPYEVTPDHLIRIEIAESRPMHNM